MKDTLERKRTTKFYRYRECVEEIIYKDLPEEIASKVSYCRDMWGPYQSLWRTIQHSTLFKSSRYFAALKKEMCFDELYEAFLRQDYHIECNDGISEKDIKQEDEDDGWILQEIRSRHYEEDWRDGLTPWEQRYYLRSSKSYRYQNDKAFINQCMKCNVPFMPFFLGLTDLYIKQLINIKLVKKTTKVLFFEKTKYSLNVSTTDLFKRIIDSVLKSDIFKNQNIKFEGLYVAFGIDKKVNTSEIDLAFIEDDIGHLYGSYSSPNNYYQYASAKGNGKYVYSDKIERYLKKIDRIPIEISTNKRNPKIVITDVVLVTK